MTLDSKFHMGRIPYARMLKYLLWTLMTLVWMRTAWVCDDAYITFRCVENAVTGHGLG